jgi:deoxynucleoside triphosphate triphosphohydrolase SAMHD1
MDILTDTHDENILSDKSSDIFHLEDLRTLDIVSDDYDDIQDELNNSIELDDNIVDDDGTETSSSNGEDTFNDVEKICISVKNIHDSIHGYIDLSYFALQIVNDSKFQRLRNLKQLGACCYVFPNATHTRFEHSIGTYYLAGELLKVITSKTKNEDIDEYLASIPTLQNYFNRKYGSNICELDEYVVELCKIAALCHDVGHGGFSHLFDDIILPEMGLADSPYATHEKRSEFILESIIKSHPILSSVVHDDEISFMKSIINPSHEHTGFLYQIVSNTLNGLDVDKYDYITRDSVMLYGHPIIDCTRLVKHVRVVDNNITYPEGASIDIVRLFQSRHTMHRQVYGHKAVISIQYLLIELFKELDPILQLSQSIYNIDKFCEIDDNYILQAPKLIAHCIGLHNEDFNARSKRALELLKRIDTHRLYHFITSYITQSKEDIKNIIISNPLVFPDADKIVVHQSKVGYVSGNKTNPLDDVYVYKTKNVKLTRRLRASKKDKSDITAIMPASYQEYVTLVFYKDKSDIKRCSEIKKHINCIRKEIKLKSNT